MQAQREKLLHIIRQLAALGLNKGTSGNASLRLDDGLLITPSGMEADAMKPQDMVRMDFSGDHHGQRKPSSEWRFHLDILNARPEIGAVIHTHSMFATTLACLQREIPPFHYMIAVTGSNRIRCAPYALFGSQALSDNALAALQDSRACLLANHGMIVLGEDSDRALALAVEVENLCEQYWRALQISEPHLLSEREMAQVFEQFKGYGKWGKPGA
ncbi:MAG TPA: class II aldolase/adducin family protein [Methylophilaceae bacterium]|nr:class II aldolase/adducin family protein [Methylophilaceae bacterium]